MLRAATYVIVLLVPFAARLESRSASTAVSEREPAARLLSSSIVVDPVFEPVFADLLASSPTFRDQYDRIASTPRVRIWVQPVFERPGNNAAASRISRSDSGVLLATVEVAAPLRRAEYAELLAHEFEHILEQIDEVDLDSLAAQRDGRVARLRSGSYETERARRAGRAAALEVERTAPRR